MLKLQTLLSFYRHKKLPGIENRFRHTAGLEQGEAQQDRIPDACPQSCAYVTAEADPLHQDGIDADAHHDKECLEPKREQ